jgi:hypothetical protein
MPVRQLFGCVFAIAAVVIAFYAVWRQERASLWSWGACLGLLLAAVAALRSPGRKGR